jgi:hypothetical protein
MTPAQVVPDSGGVLDQETFGALPGYSRNVLTAE